MPERNRKWRFKHPNSISIVKREGKYKGGQPKEIPNFAEYYARYLSRELTKSALARELGISRPMLDRIIVEFERGAR